MLDSEEAAIFGLNPGSVLASKESLILIDIKGVEPVVSRDAVNSYMVAREPATFGLTAEPDDSDES